MTQSSIVPPAPSPSPAQTFAPGRWPLLCAVVLGMIWLSALASLVWWKANPVTLNVEQLQRADLIVVGSFQNSPQGKLNVEEVLAGELDDHEIEIVRSKELPVQTGQSYLLPLMPVRNHRWEVVPSRLPGNPPLIYPMSSAVRQQYESLKASGRRQAGSPVLSVHRL